MVVVDSGVWISFLTGNQTSQLDFFRVLVMQRQVLVGDLILAEVLQGFRNDKDYGLAKEAMLECECRSMTSLSPTG